MAEEKEWIPAVPAEGVPLGGPTPVRRLGAAALSFVTAPLSTLGVVTGTAAFFVIAAGLMTPTMGARRSARLRWQERKDRARAEIEETIRKAETPEGRRP